MISSRLYLTEAATFLKMDKSTVKIWCALNGIYIYSDGHHGKKYMSRVQFLIARNRGFIEEYQQKYGNRWLEALEAHMKLTENSSE